MNADLDVARQWISKARSDLLNADNNLSSSQVPYDTVCFHCQQAAEKVLKGFLAARGVLPPRTHDLFMLLELIRSEQTVGEELEDAASVLTPYAVEARYPDDWVVPSPADAVEARQCAERFLEWVRQLSPEVFAEP